jgi:hypothetical protein
VVTLKNQIDTRERRMDMSKGKINRKDRRKRSAIEEQAELCALTAILESLQVLQEVAVLVLELTEEAGNGKDRM